jgi:valyl-tRNA synthetase
MPFITEEIWHELRERPLKDCLIVAPWPKIGKVDTILLEKMERVSDIVANIRNIRNQKNIPNNKALPLHVKTLSSHYYEGFESIITKLANLEEVTYSDATLENAISFVQGPDEFFVPMEGNIDLEAEKVRLEKELEYAKGFFDSVNKKLSNERFVQGAPPIVLEKEYQKRADAEAKIKALEESLSSLA